MVWEQVSNSVLQAHGDLSGHVPHAYLLSHPMTNRRIHRAQTPADELRIYMRLSADLLPYGFIWIPFCPDLDQAIFAPRYTFPKQWQICFHMASFRHLSVQVWSGYCRAQVHLPKAVTDLLPYGFIWTPFCPDLDQATFAPR